MPWAPPAEDRTWAPPAADRVQLKTSPLARPAVSTLLALARGAAQGATLGFNDEIEGAVQALGRRLLPEGMGGEASPAQGALSAIGPIGSAAALLLGGKKSLSDTYSEGRDVARREYRDAQEQHPIAYGAGEVLGGVAPAVASAGGAAAAPAYGIAEKLAKAGRLLATGATMGGAAGLGGSAAPTIAGQLGDTAMGAGLGAAMVPIGEGATALAGKAVGAGGRLLRAKALENARRVLVGKQNSLSAAKPVSDAAVQEALDVGAVRPFGTTTGTAERLGGALDQVGDQYGRIVQSLEQAGVKGPDAQALAQSIAAEGQAVAKGTMNRAVPAVYEQAAADLPAKAQGALPISQAESLKRSLQHLAKYDRTATSDVNDARKAVASMLRQANEDAIDAGASASGNPVTSAIAAQFQPVKAQFGRLAEAERVASAGANRIANHAGPNLTDAVAAAPMLAAHGLSAGMLAKVAAKQVRTRLPSTMAVLQNNGANLADWLTRSDGSPLSERRLLAELLRRSTGMSAVDAAVETP